MMRVFIAARAGESANVCVAQALVKLMSQGLAYHTVVHAMQGGAGMGPRERFALSLKSTLAGHSPYQGYRAAAAARRRLGATDWMVSRTVQDWLCTDLNPAIQTIRLMPDRQAAIAGYNAYNASVSLAVKTQVTAGSSSIQRQLASIQRDDELCRAGSMAVVDWMLREVAARGGAEPPPQPRSMAECARYLGAERGAALEAMQVLESCGDLSSPALASALGVGLRTFERELQSEDLNPRLLRMAARMQRAMRLLPSQKSLASVAVEAGFSDQAHMARSFKTACGMAPSLLRSLIRGTPVAACPVQEIP